MADYAVPRTSQVHRGHAGDATRKYFSDMTAQYQADPNFVLPAETKIENGRVVDNDHWFRSALLKQLALAGAGGAAMVTGAGLFGAGPLAGLLSGGTAAIPSISTTAGLPAGLPGAATVAGGAGTAGTAGAAAAAHGGAMAGFGVKDALQLGPMIAGLFTGHGRGNQVPQSAELEQILGMQRQRMQQTDPLYQAMIRMAMGLLPVSARAGMQMPGMPTQAGPMPPQLPGARVR